MIVCWPITAVRHAIRHHVVPRVIRPIRRAIAARPPVKTVTKWACIVVGTGGAVGGGVYGPGLFAAPPAAVATGPAYRSEGGLLFPAGSGFEFMGSAGSLSSGLSPTIAETFPFNVPTPPAIETPVFISHNPIVNTIPQQPVPEPSSLLLFAAGMAGLVVLRGWKRT